MASQQQFGKKKLFKVARELGVSTDRVVEYLVEEGYDDALSGSGFNASITDEEAYYSLRAKYDESFEKKNLFKVAQELDVSADRVVDYLVEEGYDDALSGSGFNASITDEEAYCALRAKYADDTEAPARTEEAHSPDVATPDETVEKEARGQDHPGEGDLHHEERGPTGVESPSDFDSFPSGLFQEEEGEHTRLFKPSPILDLRFGKALSPSCFAKGFQESTLDRLNSQLGDLSGIAFESFEYFRDKKRIYFSLSREGQKLIDAGEAYFEVHRETGKILPTIKSSGSGEFIEQVKGIRGGDLTSKLTKMGNVFVNAAHIVSGMDVVKRLDNVKNDTQFLVEARQIDQFAKLRTAYNSCREVIDLPDCEAKGTLERNYERLFELRYQVCGDVEYKLDQVDNPQEKGWVYRFFSTQKGRDQNVMSGTMNAIELGRYIEVSLLLQFALADRIGRLDRFVGRTMPDELRQIRKIADKIDECAGYLSGSYTDDGLELRSAVQYFEKIPEHYKALI